MLKLHSTAILEIPYDKQTSLTRLEKKLRDRRGVESVSLDPVQWRATVEFNPSEVSLEEIRTILNSKKENSDQNFEEHFRRQA